MAINQHVSGHTDKLTGLVRQIAVLARDVARLRNIVLRDALIAPGYRLEVRPDASPPGLYIVNVRRDDDGSNNEEECEGEYARHICS